MTLLIMAAGRGSRYGKLKQFDPIGTNGAFVMEYAIYDAISNGFTQIVIITQKEMVTFTKDYFKDKLPKNILLNVIYQDINDLPENYKLTNQRLKPWGTAHAVWAARHVITNSFAIINADDFYGKEAFSKASLFMKDQKDNFALVAYDLEKTLSNFGTVSRGICKMDASKNLVSVTEFLKIETQENHIIDIESNTTITGKELVSMNFWICQPLIFDVIETLFNAFLTKSKTIKEQELYLPSAIQQVIKDKLSPVKVLQSNSNWFGLTYAEDREAAIKQLQEMTLNQLYPIALWKPRQ